MNDVIALCIIQLLLIGALCGFATMLFVISKKRNINLFNNFKIGALIGFLTDLGDTLGVGSFATTTALFKATKLSNDDRLLPGTLNAVHAIPVMCEALLFITAVKIELTTLIPMTIAAALGAFMGPIITKKWNVKFIRLALAGALIIAALIVVFKIFFLGQITASAETTHGLHGLLLPLGLVFNFILGNLMTLGLGNYAPELIFFTLVGVNPSIAFPVMMLDAAMIMTISGVQFVKMDRVNWNGFAGIILGGILGVIVAVTLVKQLPLIVLNVLIILIAISTAISLLRTNYRELKVAE
ncbi:sodium:solute symporter [Periweissella beninensis]|uniref:sodium:solute symporter n=1 Tax=Periweissella beninensis TaxID=504936 RepID=UPI0021A4CBA4|nr:sodium:solute symporter [Periweissella beninensis]MCT4395932.1 sodium:solute symporter [Periweissella beninensis]